MIELADRCPLEEAIGLAQNAEWTALTNMPDRGQMLSTSRPDRSDKNGLATGRKSRRKAVFALCAQHGAALEVQVLPLSDHRD
jgi:hypothetical protein